MIERHGGSGESAFARRRAGRQRVVCYGGTRVSSFGERRKGRESEMQLSRSRRSLFSRRVKTERCDIYKPWIRLETAS